LALDANCWMYALGDIGQLSLSMGAYNPGNITGKSAYRNFRKVFIQFAESDGLHFTGCTLKVEKDSYPIAFFCSTDPDSVDYHCIRSNPDGTWSRKFIRSAPSLVTWIGGQPIYNIAEDLDVLCLRLNDGTVREYDFAGFMNVPRSLSIDRRIAIRRIEAALNAEAEESIVRFGTTSFQKNSGYGKELNTQRHTMLDNLRQGSGPLVVPQA